MITQFAEQSLNAVIYNKNKDFRKFVSLVPTSALSGEGIPDLLYLLIQLTQKMLTSRLYYSPKLSCTVLEVKAIEGFGTTIDVILVNGELKEGTKFKFKFKFKFKLIFSLFSSIYFIYSIFFFQKLR